MPRCRRAAWSTTIWPAATPGVRSPAGRRAGTGREAAMSSTVGTPAGLAPDDALRIATPDAPPHRDLEHRDLEHPALEHPALEHPALERGVLEHRAPERGAPERLDPRR